MVPDPQECPQTQGGVLGDAHLAVSILFLVQDVSVAPKFISNDFWKIVSTSYRIGRIFGKGSVVELWGNGAYVGGT